MTTNGNNGLGWKFFFVLLAFVAGNGTNYIVFGLHTVTREEFKEEHQENQQVQNTENNEIEALRSEMNRLTGELRGRKLIDEIP